MRGWEPVGVKWRGGKRDAPTAGLRNVAFIIGRTNAASGTYFVFYALFSTRTPAAHLPRVIVRAHRPPPHSGRKRVPNARPTSCRRIAGNRQKEEKTTATTRICPKLHSQVKRRHGRLNKIIKRITPNDDENKMQRNIYCGKTRCDSPPETVKTTLYHFFYFASIWGQRPVDVQYDIIVMYIPSKRPRHYGIAFQRFIAARQQQRKKKINNNLNKFLKSVVKTKMSTRFVLAFRSESSVRIFEKTVPKGPIWRTTVII